MHILKLLPRFRQASREVVRLAAREQWTRTQIEAYQLDRLNAIWEHARHFVPHYRELASREGWPGKFDSLEHYRATVPILDKRVVRAQPHRLLSERPRRGAWRFTGGSTGTVTRVFREHAAHFQTQRCKYRQAAMWGVDFLDRSVFVWGHGASFAPGWRGRLARARRPIEDRLRNRLRLSAYDLSSPVLRRHLRAIEAWRPRSLYTYSTCAYLLAREAADRGFGCDSLQYALLTAEPTPPWLIASVERAFGVPAIREYGSIECGILATEWTDRTLRVREDVSLLETVPRDDGRFDVIVTVLQNPSFPLLRYAIADVADEPLAYPVSGFAVLSNVVGRANDLVVSRTGRPLHGLWFDDLFERTPGARRWRVHQTPSGEVAIAVEMDRGAPPLDARRISRAVQSHLEGFPVQVRTVERLAQNAAGKHRWVLSDLAHTPLAQPRKRGATASSPLAGQRGRHQPRARVDASA